MPLRVQYPTLGRRTRSVDFRAKWFTAIYDEVRRRIPTEFLRLFYVPVSPRTYWIYRSQMALFERRDAITHVVSQMHSFLLRKHDVAPTMITCYDLYAAWTLRFLSRADRVVVPTNHIREALRKAVDLPRDPDVVPLAVPPAYHPGVVPRKSSQILFVGTEQSRKNVPGLFRIFARVLRETPATLVKVGAPSEERPRLRQLAHELGIHDAIVWMDSVPEEELLDLYRTSSLALVPSLVEGFSMPCLEAMSCGCPLVASTESAIPETVGKGGLLIDPTDDEAWARAILQILGDSNVARGLSERGIERSRDFSPRASAAKLLRIYEELWTERKGR